MNFEEVFLSPKDCNCSLFEREQDAPVNIEHAYLKPFWNFVKHRINEKNLNWERCFKEESMFSLKGFYFSNAHKWSEKTILYSALQELSPLSALEKYRTVEGYSLEQYTELWIKYCRQYPGVEKRILIWTEDFISHVAEIVSRTLDTRGEMTGKLLTERAGKVENIDGGVADIHGGRCVHILTFESGEKIVYKPRDLRLDQLWGSFLNFLTDKAELDRFKTYQCIIKDNYGFEEFVQASPVADQEEFKEFYFNFGFLLGAIYFLQGSDFHSENVIACGKYPVLIDLETIVRSGNITAFLDVVSSAKPFELDSVMRSNLLPYLSPGKNYKAGYDALTVRLPGAMNLPYTPDGAYETGREHADDVIGGFELCYRTLLDYGRDLFLEGGALDGIKTCSARFLIRDTGDYVKYLKLLSSRECMEAESIFEKKLGNLEKLYHSLSEGKGILQKLKGFLEIEKESLRRGYIPKLTISMDEELPGSEKYKTCYDYLIHKHEFMNDDDREKQILTIRRVISNKTARDGSRKVIEYNEAKRTGDDFLEKSFAEELTGYMNRWLKRWTRLMEAGRVSGYIVEPEHYYYYYSVLEHPFSEGYLGLAPALAAWYKLTGSEDAKTLLEKIAEKLEAILEAKPPALFGEGLIDGLDGLCLILRYTAETTELPGYSSLLEIALDALIQRKAKVNYLNPSPLSLYYSLTASIYALAICNKGNEERINHKLYELVSMQMEYVNHSLKEYRYGLMNGLDGFILAVSAAKRFLPDGLNQKLEDFMKQAKLLTEAADSTCGGYSIADGYAGHIIARGTGRSDLRRPDLHGSDLPFVENTNFAFGSAGIIYVLDLVGKHDPGAGYAEQAARYAEWVLKIINKDGIVHNLPSQEPIPSFQYGEGGIMYSLIHHLNPSAVDPIF
ncbi:MAG: DUF4135 domain-containing protein [Eubacteriales bacterium]|nr:DUF4135 domain-containing protein [Eubacteriales bacterium]